MTECDYKTRPSHCRLLWDLKCAAAGGRKCRHGFRGGLSGAHRPHPQELPEAVQPPD